ncbi:MAG TPA: MazG family protein, partial [Homoserinimonas sp.]|nr:MazG family protein [Homoserinimonas sp.]
MTDAPHPKLEELISVLEQLRAPGGCAWDREQTHESLVKYLVEETYELIDAIETGNRQEMIEELGDVLYQVIFHSDIAAHTPGEDFTLEDVAAHMTKKMIGRHPHVFGDEAAQARMNIRSADDVVAAWDGLKATEKPGRTSVLDGIPQGMPALALADKVIGRAEKLGVLDA